MLNVSFLKQMRMPWLLFAIAITTLALDLVTKSWVSAYLSLGDRVNVIPYFDITLRHNYGAAFSIFGDGSQRWLLTVVAAVMSVVLIVWLTLLKPDKKVEGVALALILGGAVGNLYDRATLGYVVDFLLVYYNDEYQYPAFNIADSGICVGAGLLIYDAFMGKKDAADD